MSLASAKLLNTLAVSEHFPVPPNLKCDDAQNRTPIGTSIIAYGSRQANPRLSSKTVRSAGITRYKNQMLSGLRFPFTPRALSGWYVPSPDLVSRFWAYLNGRNAEYSGHLASRITRPVLKPDREEKGLGLWPISLETSYE